MPRSFPAIRRLAGWAGRQRHVLAVRPVRAAGLGRWQQPRLLAALAAARSAAGTGGSGGGNEWRRAGWPRGGRPSWGGRRRLGDGRGAGSWGWGEHAMLSRAVQLGRVVPSCGRLKVAEAEREGGSRRHAVHVECLVSSAWAPLGDVAAPPALPLSRTICPTRSMCYLALLHPGPPGRERL